MRTYWGLLIGALVGVLGGIWGVLVGGGLGFLADLIYADVRLHRSCLHYLEHGESPAWLPARYPLAGAVAAHTLGPGEFERQDAATPLAVEIAQAPGDSPVSRTAVRMTASGASFTDAHAGDAQETLARRITELEQNSAQELFAGVWRLLEDREAEVEAYRRLRALARAGSLNSGFIRNELQVPSRLDPVACKVLGVPRDARLSEVRAAYRTLAAQFHPDATRELHDDERARSAEAFLKIQNAYEKLRTQLAHTGTE